MTAFNDMIMNDSVAIRGKAADLAEALVYRKASSRSTERSIFGTVVRKPPEIIAPDKISARLNIEVQVINDAETGISAAEIVPGNDELKVVVNIGEDARWMTIAQLVSHDAGSLTLKLR